MGNPQAESMADQENKEKKGERIAKRLARAGVCSRRAAEELILSGKVRVNGALLKTPALNVSDSDRIEVNGKPLAGKEPTRLWRYHKPRGLVTSHKDEKGRDTIFQNLPEDLPRVISVGRLDLNSEGLLLLTNDGALSRHLELPSTGWTRQYRVRAFGKIRQGDLEMLKQGVTVNGVAYGPIDAAIEKEQGSNVWLLMTLREGKNREIRNVLEHIGLAVNRLIRTSYGPFHLGKLPPEAVEEISPKSIREALGNKFT